ncbi:Calx-beta domain-containing protein [uncultured Sulfitobacter sp.]|uniref:Calx-beta domain-containing protein n=1 Tax=uncultured Sulfitobacter sp. TaxID=191468 RepID=UPI00263394B1|nr:Calx-beta domain-containing protein [uncultured Sulfitobacter sp.]
MTREVIFTQTDIDLGSDSRSYDFTQTIGNLGGDWESADLRASLPNPFGADVDVASLTFDYKFWSRFGFEVDFAASLGSASVVAPLLIDLDQQAVAPDDVVTFDTSAWNWGSGVVVSNGPSYSLDVDFVTELLFAVRPESASVNLAPDEVGDAWASADIDLPSLLYTENLNTGFRYDLLSLDSDTGAEESFEIGDVTFTAALPTTFGAVTSEADDYGPNGQVIADSLSNPIFTAGFNVIDLLEKIAPIAEVLRKEISTPIGDLSWTVLDMTATAGLRLAQEVLFDPGAVQVRLTDQATGAHQTGLLGESFDFLAGADDLNITAEFDLSGAVSTRWGLAPELVFGFDTLGASLSSPILADDVTFGPFSDEFRFQFDPVYFLDGPLRDITFATQTEVFTVDVDPGLALEPAAPPPQPVASVFAGASVIAGQSIGFSITLDQVATQATSIGWTAFGLTAEAGDFASGNGSVTIAAGQRSATVQIATYGDGDFEDETIGLRLTSASGAVLGSSREAYATIIDPDTAPDATPAPPPPPLPDGTAAPTIARPVLFATRNDRGDEGEVLSFEIVLDKDAPSDVTVSYRIAGITSEQGDVGITQGTAIIAAGRRSVFVDVPTTVDDDGDDERFRLEVIGLDGADMSADTTAFGTITDIYTPPATPPVFGAFNDVTVAEGAVARFVLALDGPANNDMRLTYTITDLTSENTDYYPIGNYETTVRRGDTQAVIEVQTLADTDSRDETFRIDLISNSGGDLPLDTSAIGTITDDDPAPRQPVVTVTGSSDREGREATFAFDLDYNPTFSTVRVFYRVEGGTATEGIDFADRPGQQFIDLASDTQTKTLRVNTFGDTLPEDNETIQLIIDRVEGGTASAAVVNATIIDDDVPGAPLPVYYFGTQSAPFEGGALTFSLKANYAQIGGSVLSQVHLNGLTLDDVNSVVVNYSDTNSSGVLGFRTDTYQKVGATWQNMTTGQNYGAIDTPVFNVLIHERALQLGGGSTIGFTINTANDSVYTGDKVFFADGVTLGGPATYGGSVSNNSWSGTVRENDPLPHEIILSDAVVVEGGTAQSTLALDRAAIANLVVSYRISDADGTEILTDTVTIAAGENTAAIVHPTVDDTIGSGDQTLSVEILTIAGAQVEIISGRARIIVLENDAMTQVGTDQAERITGGSENDLLSGLAGADVIEGRSGDDTVQGGEGGDRLSGGAGRDMLSYSASTSGVNVSLLTGFAAGGDAQDDRISGFEGITGSGMQDTLSGDLGHNMLLGGGGDDLLRGRAGQDRIDGGAGRDTATYSDSAAGVNISLLTGYIAGGDAAGDVLSGIENLTGSQVDDRLSGDAEGNILSGGAGDDILRGRGGADTLIGGAGMDWADYADSAGWVNASLLTGYAGGGADNHASADRWIGIENLTGSRFGDRLNGDHGNNILRGGEGADVLNGYGGSDWADYSDSVSFVNVSLSTGFAGGGIGSAALGDKWMSIENLIGSNFADRLNGNNDDNILAGGASADSLNGNGGFDTADYAQSEGFVNVSLLTGYSGGGTGSHAAGDTFSGIEALRGSRFADRLNGDNGANVLAGGLGADTLQGNGGEDTLDYSGSAGHVDVSLLAAYAWGAQDSDARGDVIAGFENIWGSAQDDSLTGDHSDNTLAGNGGEDLLAGLGGGDVLAGGGGQDWASYAASGSFVNISLATGFAGGGSDSHARGDSWISIENLIGSHHDDILNGDQGANILRGGLGADVLRGYGGMDTADYSTSAAFVNISLASGFAGGGAGGDAIGDSWEGIENLRGSRFADRLNGDAGANVLEGKAGGDVLDGNGGSDWASYASSAGGVNVSLLTGFAGGQSGSHAVGDTFIQIENLTGSVYADILNGDHGANRLDGAGGNDVLRGYLGADLFVFTDGFGQDVIADFQDGMDLLDFSMHSGVTGIDDLMIRDSGADAQVWDGAGNIVTVRDAAGLLDVGDFVF